MIINIPLQIDEKVIEKCLSVDYEKKVQDYLCKEVEQVLLDHCGYYNKSTKNGMSQIVRNAVDEYVIEWKDEIIEKASERLAERLTRTKKAKELIDEQIH